MGASHQMLLGFSIVVRQIIDFLEIDASWLLDLLKLLLLSKWLIYRNDY